MTKAKIDTKAALAAVDNKDRDYFSKLSQAEQKALGNFFYMLQRSLSSTEVNSKHHIYFTNLFCNKGFLADTGITKHPELMWKSFCAVGKKPLPGKGKSLYHPYVKPPTSVKKKNYVRELLSELYPLLKDDDLDVLMAINTTEELTEIAKSHGVSDKQIKKIFSK